LTLIRVFAVPRSMPISLENKFPKSFLNMEVVENQRVVGKLRWPGGFHEIHRSGGQAREERKDG
jgi:hypothetical protein